MIWNKQLPKEIGKHYCSKELWGTHSLKSDKEKGCLENVENENEKSWVSDGMRSQ